MNTNLQYINKLHYQIRTSYQPSNFMKSRSKILGKVLHRYSLNDNYMLHTIRRHTPDIKPNILQHHRLKLLKNERFQLFIDVPMAAKTRSYSIPFIPMNLVTYLQTNALS